MERNINRQIKIEPNFQIKEEPSDVDLLLSEYTSINSCFNNDQLSREIKFDPWIDIGDFQKQTPATEILNLKKIKPENTRETESPALVSDRDLLMLDYKPFLNTSANQLSFKNNIRETQHEDGILFPFDVHNQCNNDKRFSAENKTNEGQIQRNQLSSFGINSRESEDEDGILFPHHFHNQCNNGTRFPVENKMNTVKKEGTEQTNNLGQQKSTQDVPTLKSNMQQLSGSAGPENAGLQEVRGYSANVDVVNNCIRQVNERQTLSSQAPIFDEALEQISDGVDNNYSSHKNTQRNSQLSQNSCFLESTSNCVEKFCEPKQLTAQNKSPVNGHRSTVTDVHLAGNCTSRPKRKSAVRAMEEISKLDEDMRNIDDENDPMYNNDETVVAAITKSKTALTTGSKSINRKAPNGPNPIPVIDTNTPMLFTVQNYLLLQSQPQVGLSTIVVSGTNPPSQMSPSQEQLKRKRSDSGEVGKTLAKRHCSSPIQPDFNGAKSTDPVPEDKDRSTNCTNQAQNIAMMPTDLQRVTSSKQTTNPTEVLKLKGHNSSQQNTDRHCAETGLNGYNTSNIPNPTGHDETAAPKNKSTNEKENSQKVAAFVEFNSANLSLNNDSDIGEARGNNSAETKGKPCFTVFSNSNSPATRVRERTFKKKKETKVPQHLKSGNWEIMHLLKDEDDTKKKKSDRPKLFCEFCQRQFKLSYFLNKHIEAVHKSVQLETCRICDVCGLECSDLNTLKSHMSNHKKRFTCGICNTQWSTTYNLKTHMLSHTGEKPHKCEHCDQSFSRIDNLKLHMKSMHKDVDVLPYNCKICSEKFKTAKEKHTHFQSVHGLKSERNERTQCDLCNMKFTTKKRIWVKHKKHHDEGRIFTCQICNKSILLTKRKNIACDIKDGDDHKKSCLPCFKTWAKKNHPLAEATSLIINVLKTCHCRVCKQRFPGTQRLASHMWRHHSIRE